MHQKRNCLAPFSHQTLLCSAAPFAGNLLFLLDESRGSSPVYFFSKSSNSSTPQPSSGGREHTQGDVGADVPADNCWSNAPQDFQCIRQGTCALLQAAQSSCCQGQMPLKRHPLCRPELPIEGLPFVYGNSDKEHLNKSDIFSEVKTFPAYPLDPSDFYSLHALEECLQMDPSKLLIQWWILQFTSRLRLKLQNNSSSASFISEEQVSGGW